MGRRKCALVREVAGRNGWLGDGPLPEERQIGNLLEPAISANPTRVAVKGTRTTWFISATMRSPPWWSI
jgi:hypothetical protein